MTNTTTQRDPPNPGHINAAIVWYRKHKEAISQTLPIASPGRIFTPGWANTMERYIALWEAEKLGIFLAVAYIHRPLSIVKETLLTKHHHDPTQKKHDTTGTMGHP